MDYQRLETLEKQLSENVGALSQVEAGYGTAYQEQYYRQQIKVIENLISKEIAKMKKDLTTTATVEQLEMIIDLHEKMKGSYFFTPPTNASSRRSYEQKNSQFVKFLVDDKNFEVYQTTVCSCKNVYYSLKLSNGKDIRFIKKLLKTLVN